MESNHLFLPALSFENTSRYEIASVQWSQKSRNENQMTILDCAGAYFKQSYLHHCFSGAHVRSEASIQLAAQRSKHTASLVFSDRFRYSSSSQRCSENILPKFMGNVLCQRCEK